MKKFILSLVSVSLLSSALPFQPVSANNEDVKEASFIPTYSIYKSEDYLSLSNKEKTQFNELVNSGVFSNQELESILKDKRKNKSPFRWKIAAIKKAARFISKKLGTKTVAEISDFLFGWQDNLEEGIALLLLRNGWNREVARWTARSIMFIIF